MFLTSLSSFDEHVHIIVTTNAADEPLVNIVNLSALLKCVVYFTDLGQKNSKWKLD
jgi:hypothetical protein